MTVDKNQVESRQEKSNRLANQTLQVYESNAGADYSYWSNQHEELDLPDGWEFLPSGDQFVTRRVKQELHWVVRGAYNRKRGYTKTLGVVAPSSHIHAAEQAAAQTAKDREHKRAQAAKSRQKKEDTYKDEFRSACIEYLNFAPSYQALAKAIAESATETACEKHSGRVGRTSRIDLRSKAQLAVRADIRHQHTDYDEHLSQHPYPHIKEVYEEIKARYSDEVDEFLDRHR